jgi:hypothetical protein
MASRSASTRTTAASVSGSTFATSEVVRTTEARESSSM